MNDCSTRSIDIFITSASRPNCLVYTLNGFLEKAKFAGKFRFLMNEDFVDPEESTYCLREANKLLDRPIIKCNHPPIGLSGAFHNFAINDLFKSKYMFYLQDDFVLIREIDFNDVFSMIGSWSDIMAINQLRFNKRKTMAYKGSGDTLWDKEEISLGEYTLTTSDAVYLNPALWNMEFFKPVLAMDFTRKPKGRPFVWKMNQHIAKSFKVKKDDKTRFSRVVGTYIYGRIGEPAYFKHIGSDQRMQLKSGVW